MARIATAPLLLATALTAAQAQPSYSIKKLGPLPGHGGSSASAVNDNTQVSGWSIGGAEVPYRWSDGVMEALPVTGPGTSNFALGLNGPGQVVGYASFPSAPSNAALWTKNDNGTWNVEDLGILPGFFFSRAADLSDDGTWAVGDVDDAIDHILAVEYSRQPGMPWQVQSMGALPGYFGSYALGLHDSGVAVGASYNPFANARATRWTRTQTGWTLEALPLLPGGFDHSIATAVNDSGVVTGYALASDFLRHAVLWTSDGIIDLGVYPGENTDALAINNSAAVVGETWAAGRIRAFLAQNNQIHDLNTLIPPDIGWTLRSATGINDQGQIVGEGDLGGFRHSYLLTPAAADLAGPVPGVAGAANAFTVSPATNTPIHLFYASATGETAIPGCTEVPLNLASPTYLATFPAGVTTITVVLPDSFSGQTLYFQTVVPSACAVSNVVKHTFP